ncbi:MAG TPA: redox-regulated ATPase YchF [Acidimicrobiia bacterium]|nr:redox-regulated ATPase YchF [Acidimicrobiia bacterium]
MAHVGLVGLPNVGKTTLFNALTGLEAHTAPHPFSTVEPAMGVARVPDPLVEQLAAVEQPDKIVHATLDLLDLPAMARPGSSGLGARFLARLREEEAVAVVLRAFEDEGVSDDESGTDPAEQAEALLLELALADLEVFTRKVEKAVKEAAADPAKRPAAAAVARGVEVLNQGRALRTESWDEQERAAFQDLAPLTLKPAVWVVNVGEDDASAAEKVAAVAALVPAGDTVVALSARIEEEASRLDAEDRAELLQGFGLGEGALARVVNATYDALNLLTFYTVGPKEVHARTVQRGASAREAAGKIHSDMERGFIRAEIAPAVEVVAAGGWDAAKAAGRVKVEGRDYVLVEGDVMVVRFSV